MWSSNLISVGRHPHHVVMLLWHAGRQRCDAARSWYFLNGRVLDSEGSWRQRLTEWKSTGFGFGNDSGFPRLWCSFKIDPVPSK
jgi:hypothetical protein